MILQMTRQQVAIGPHSVTCQFFPLPWLNPGAAGREQRNPQNQAHTQHVFHGIFAGALWVSWEEPASNSMMSFTCCFLVLLLKNPVQID